MELTEVKELLDNLNQKDISFHPHFYRRTSDRPVNEGMVRDFLAKKDKLEKIERGRKGRFKLWFRMSRKYSLVLIVEVIPSKSLKVVSAWNTNRKWQDKLKQ